MSNVVSFDELWKSYSGENKLPENVLINIAYKAGAQSRQAEIDELQSRIDEALKYTVCHGGYYDLTHIINILNGK